MKTIVPVVTAVVLALALMSASAAPTHHKRHTTAKPPLTETPVAVHVRVWPLASFRCFSLLEA